jgi:hypothetical protein
LETVGASIASSRSMVPTTADRLAGSATNGVAYDDASAQPYSVAADCSDRLAAHSRPPLPLNHRSCWSSRKIVASAGVF